MIRFLWSYLCGDHQVSAHPPHPLASAPSQAPLASAPERKKKSKQPPTGYNKEDGIGMGGAGAGRMLGRLPLWAWGAMSLCGHISRPHQLTPAAGSPLVTVPSSTSPLSTQPPPFSSWAIPLHLFCPSCQWGWDLRSGARSPVAIPPQENVRI